MSKSVTTKKQMRFHPAAEIFPLLEGKDFDELKGSIKDHKQQTPIYTLKDEILDGRNRYLACVELKVEPWFVEADLDGLTPLQFVLVHNEHRRHLTASQRAMVGARVKEILEAESKDRRDEKLLQNGKNTEKTPLAPDGANGKSSEAAAASVGSTPRSVERAAAVLKKGTPAVVAAVEAGKVSVTTAAEIAAKPKAEQPAALKQATKPKPARGKEVVNRAKLVDELSRKHVGLMVRGIDAIAKVNGGKGPVHAEANTALNTLIGCLKKMREGVK